MAKVEEEIKCKHLLYWSGKRGIELLNSWGIIPAKEAYYPIQHNDRFMRDFLVVGMNSDLLRKDCFKVGNAFTFKEVRDMAKSEESADKQLQLMNTQIYSINVPKGYQGQGNQLPTPYTG
ncbi:unnamed protein product [Porites evermanni]|uniref:Uncharacterized protein n=1 Tax=Porites evermanni TaxID=104178 RepID=A0ABN8LR86_9CNID|nr:unnamed protein product [Porites evermanni]